MKVLFENYSFDATAKTVTFNTTDTITLEQLLIITNVTTNQIVYNFADPNAGGNIASNVLTLDYDTTSMSSTDKLQIFFDNVATPASDESLQLINEQTELLRRMIKLLEPSANANSVGQQRVEISSMVPAVVSNHNQTYMGGGQNNTVTAAETTLFPQSRQSYAMIRRNLEFS